MTSPRLALQSPTCSLPAWSAVQPLDWTPWDEDRDGFGTIIDTSNSASALAAALEVIQGGGEQKATSAG